MLAQRPRESAAIGARPSDMRACPCADDCGMPLPVYTGPFGPAQAERLLWRAGFGPRPGEDARSPERGLDGAVAMLLTTGPDSLVGKPPKVDGRRLVPARQVRSRPPLVARPHGAHVPPLTRADDARLARLVRDLERDGRLAAPDDPPEQHVPPLGLGSFPGLVMRVTENPAMLAVPQRARQREGRAERELRPRADGALHARPRTRATPSATCASRRAR